MRFSDVVGHAQLKEDLIKEVNQDHISHAQLFIGKAGYGVLPLALAFVQYLFCENKQTEDSCGECQACKKVEKLQHPDLHFSFPTVQPISKTADGLITEWREMILENPYFDLNGWIRFMDPKERMPIIGKDESQEIIKKLNLRSFEGGYKVMMIWMAEEMNQSSANKLLKILEEPPGNTLFILMAETEEMMLQTILSRTQKVRVPRIKLEDLSSYLRMHKNQSSGNADSIAARVDGDLIEAQDFLGDHIDQDENREQFIQLMRVCYKKSVLEMMDWSDGIGQKSREFQKVFLKYALHMFRQSLLKNYTEETLVRVSAEEANFLEKFAKFITGNNIGDFLQTFSDAHYHIERNANPRILFTQLCFEVMRYIHKA